MSEKSFILNLIQSRRSIRSFKPDSLTQDEIDKLLEAARWAPSAGNRQPVEIIIVKSSSQKEALVKAALGQAFIESAPVVFVVCADLNRSSSRYGSRGSSLYAIQDAAAATQNILLTAEEMGYATVWIGAFDEDSASSVVKLPKNVRPLAIIPIGKPSEKPAAPPKRNISEFSHREFF